MNRAIVALASFWIAVTAHAASFDCLKASTNIEKLICSNARLSKLDENLSVAYKMSLERDNLKHNVAASQKQWLKNIRNVCTDVSCATFSYKIRIRELVLTMLKDINTASHTPPQETKDLILGKWVAGSRAFDGFDFEISENTATMFNGEWSGKYLILKFETGIGPSRTMPWMKNRWHRVSIWIESAAYEVLVFTIQEGSECSAGIELYTNVESYIINPDTDGAGWGVWSKQDCTDLPAQPPQKMQ